MQHEIIYSLYDDGCDWSTLVDEKRVDLRPKPWNGIGGVDMDDENLFEYEWHKEAEKNMSDFAKLVSVKCGFKNGDTIRLIVCENGCICIRKYIVMDETVKDAMETQKNLDRIDFLAKKIYEEAVQEISKAYSIPIDMLMEEEK